MPLDPSSFDRAEPLAPTIIDAAPTTPSPALFAQALLLGLGGAFAGAILYALSIGISHINIGYMAIGVAYLIAKAMTFGSRGQGGRNYQIAAIILTYLSAGAAHSLLLWWQIHHDGSDLPLNLQNLVALAQYGVLSPFTRFQQDGFGAAIGLFILFVALRAAWRMTSGIPGAVRHPFAR